VEDSTSSKPVSHRTKLLYGVGAFGYGSTVQTMNSFLMFFGTGILGIPGALMGVAIAISTVWDATTDPFVGHFSDKTRSRFFGKRHGYLLVGAIMVAVFNILVWSINPGLPIWAKFVLLLTLLLGIETFNTFYSTPYQALGLDLSKSYQDRTLVQNYKTVFSFLSLLVPSLLMIVFLSPTRYATMGASSQGYRDIAIVTSILCIICGLIVFFGTYKHRPIYKPIPNENQEKSKGIITDFFSVVKQKNVGRLILGYAISLSAAAFITSLGLHVFTFTFQFSTNEIPVVMVSLIIGIIVGQPIWYHFSKRTDKVTALIVAIIVVILGILAFGMALAFRNQINPYAVLPLVALTIFICGVGSGCLYSLPISMFADCIDRANRQNNTDKTAVSAGFLTFCTKVSNAFIMFIIGVSLDLIGFRGNQATQSLFVQNMLGFVLVSGVVVACTLALFVYSGYSFSKKDFENN